MSTRSRALLKQAKSKSKKVQKLETADDFQAAGVDHEDAAGKWRAGDATKSVRFFQRAIEVYAQGLERYPQSLDLAYNKARVEFELATHPILVKHLQIPVLSQLQSALQSHRIALDLDQNNPDTLFNTAQVLTSIAEEYAKEEERPTVESLSLLEEALNLQDRCLNVQETRYKEHLQLQQQPNQPDVSTEPSSDGEEGGVTVPESTDMQEEDQWFSIVEPVTVDVLVDTILAELNTLTTLCGVLSSSPESAPPATLPWIEDVSSKLLLDKLPILANTSQDPERVQEIALTKAKFISSLLEGGFRTGRIDMDTYKRERDTAFTQPELLTDSNVDVLIANARSLLSLNSSLSDAKEQTGLFAQTRWTALSIVMTELTKASKIPGISADDLAKTHLYRGDTALLEYMMSQEPLKYPSAVANETQLLKNAEVYYRNASRLSPDDDDRMVASLRSAVATCLITGEKTPIMAFSQSKGSAWVQDQMEDMSLEGLLPGGLSI